MKNIKPIITSILDNDLYKYSMQNAVIKKFPNAKVKYKFINRGNHKFPRGFIDELSKQISYVTKLRLQPEEKKWLEDKCDFFDPLYINFLDNFKFDSSEIQIIQSGEDLDITFKGFWYSSILWEVVLMALISELYFIMTKQKPHSLIQRSENNLSKVQLFEKHNIHYADFGTRRRFSFQIQDEMVKDFGVNHTGIENNFVGTSNVYLAFKYNLTPIGTHAHEWFMFHGAKYGYKMANHLALENWVDVYRGDLGIALSDTYTTFAFLKSFDKKFAKLFDGVRHDSGDPFLFADKVIMHYQILGIDPMTKVIVFSDGLNPQKTVDLKKHCQGKIKCSFGIGTNFSNDVGVKPLNMVIKMVKAMPEGDSEWIDCIKLSDDVGKHTGLEKEIEVAKYLLKIK